MRLDIQLEFMPPWQPAELGCDGRNKADKVQEKHRCCYWMETFFCILCLPRDNNSQCIKVLVTAGTE